MMKEIEKQAMVVRTFRDIVNSNYTEDIYNQFVSERKQLANMIMQTARYGTHVTIDRATLALVWKMDFPKGTVIDCGKYVIFVNGLKTEAATRENPFKTLNSGQLPQYIYNFVF